MDLYDKFSSSLNASDDLLIFYFDLLSHIDATLRELIRDKVASLFKKDIKSDVLSQSSSKKNKDANQKLTEQNQSQPFCLQLYASPVC